MQTLYTVGIHVLTQKKSKYFDRIVGRNISLHKYDVGLNYSSNRFTTAAIPIVVCHIGKSLLQLVIVQFKCIGVSKAYNDHVSCL